MALTDPIRYDYWSGTLADDRSAIGSKFTDMFGYELTDDDLTTAFSGGEISVNPDMIPDDWTGNISNQSGTNQKWLEANDPNYESDATKWGNMAANAWETFMGNNPAQEGGTGFQGAGFDSSFDPQATTATAFTPGAGATGATPFSPTATTQGTAPAATTQGTFNPTAVNQGVFSPTTTAATSATNLAPYTNPQAGVPALNALGGASNAANVAANTTLTGLQNAPTTGAYDISGIQNTLANVMTGAPTAAGTPAVLPQVQPLLDELARQQEVERNYQAEQMTNRGLGNSTISDTARSDLQAQQQNQMMNMATNANLQLMPMQAQMMNALQQSGLTQRNQELNELMQSTQMLEGLEQGQYGRDLGARQQAFNEMTGGLGLQEALTQGQYGREAGAAQLEEALAQGQFGREATQAQLGEALTQGQFGRDAGLAQLTEDLTQGQYGRDAGTAQLNEALNQGAFGRQAAAAQLQDQLTGSQFDRTQRGRQGEFDEFSRLADLFNQNRQIDYNQRIGAVDAFSNLLGRMPGGQVAGSGQAPGPDAMESTMSALMKFLGTAAGSAI